MTEADRAERTASGANIHSLSNTIFALESALAREARSFSLRLTRAGIGFPSVYNNFYLKPLPTCKHLVGKRELTHYILQQKYLLAVQLIRLALAELYRDCHEAN